MVRRGASPAAGVLVVGYGNPLRGDDGAGQRAADLLADDPRVAGATVLARHQLTPELADEMRTASLVVFVDARAGAVPGTIAVEHVAAGAAGVATAGGAGASSHQVDPATLVALARDLWEATPDVWTVSIGAAAFDAGDALSPEVARALPGVAAAVARLVAERARA